MVESLFSVLVGCQKSLKRQAVPTNRRKTNRWQVPGEFCGNDGLVFQVSWISPVFSAMKNALEVPIKLTKTYDAAAGNIDAPAGNNTSTATIVYGPEGNFSFFSCHANLRRLC